jgi:2-polyprenyl-6-methoxyphenol hydroxylase-like FAD-dependent oxidoreductase
MHAPSRHPVFLRYGEPYYTVRRADVQAALLQALPGDSPQYGKEVTDIEPSSSNSGMRVVFRDGSRSDDHFDAVVGADGIDSCVRRFVLDGVKVRQKESAAVNVIGVAPLDALCESEDIASALDQRNGFCVYLDPAMTLILAKVTPSKVMWGLLAQRPSHAQQGHRRASWRPLGSS